jgi:hypothetical protein
LEIDFDHPVDRFAEAGELVERSFRRPQTGYERAICCRRIFGVPVSV